MLAAVGGGFLLFGGLPSEAGARQIGVELNVANILDGSVRRSQNRVRVGVQLIRASTDEQLWAESFDRELTDIFEIQSEIARQIAETLQTRLSPEQHQRLARVPTENLEAYDLYLRGREHSQRLSLPDLEAAMGLFRRAIALDPEFALAHAGVGWVFSAMHGYHGLGLHLVDSASVAAARAVRLDPAGADGYGILALAQWNGGRFAEAVETYGRTLEIRPNDAESHWGLAFIRWAQGEYLEARSLATRATELDPANPGYATLLGRTQAALGDLERAEQSFRRAMRLQPDFPWAHQDLLWMLIGHGEVARAEFHLRAISERPSLAREYHQQSFVLALAHADYHAAAEWYDRGSDRMPGGVVGAADAGFALARSGQHERAREVWREGTARSEEAVPSAGDDYGPVLSLARIAAATGDLEGALPWLERATDMGWRAYPTGDAASDPLLEGLHGDPRFERLRSRILEDLRRMREQGTDG